MNRILSYISVAVILLSACVKQSDGGNGNRREIHFAAAVGTYSTKAMDTSFEQGDAIGISANDPVGLVNQKLTINDGKLTPESTLYWPVSQLSTQKADFYAYYPYAQDRDLSKGIDFTVKADQSTHTLFTASDLMTAFTSASPSDEAVSLLFTHRLTKIVLKIDNQLESDIADVYVGNVRGRATVKANEDPVVEGTRGTIKACPVTLEGDVKAWALVVVPQTANLRLMITSTDQKQYTYSLAEDVELKPGYRYTAAITINAESLSSDFTSEVTEWTDNADTQFSRVITTDSIKEVLEADDNTQVCIEGIVHALSTRSFVLYDGDASINVYTTSAPTCTIGDKVKVQGVKVHYQYVPEISSPTVDVLSSGNELLEINYAGINQGFETFSSPVTIPVELTGTLSISKPVSRTYYDIAVAGVEGVQGAMYWPTEDLGVEAWNGKEVTVKGFYFGYRTSSGVKYHDIIVTSVSEPSHYPQTEEEWEASLELANTIAGDIKSILTSKGFYDGNTNADDYIPLIKSIMGVADAYTINSGEFIVIRQKDGFHFNVPFQYLDAEIVPSTQTKSVQEMCRSTQGDNSIIVSNNEQKKALLLLPYYTRYLSYDKNNWIPIKADTCVIRAQLKDVGYHLDAFLDKEATFDRFSPPFLSNYDLVLIGTHGAALTDTKGRPCQFAFFTGDRCSPWMLEYFEELSVIFTDDEFRYAIPVDEMRRYRMEKFNNSIVLAMACHSFETPGTQEIPEVVDYFMSHGCAAYCGIYGGVSLFSMGDGIEKFVDYLTKGASVSTTVLKIRDLKSNDFFIPLRGKMNENRDIYLVDTTPYNLVSTIGDSDSQVTLSWEVKPNTGDYKYNVYWSDNTLIQGGIEAKSLTIDVDTPGNYTWYVVSVLYDGETIIETHQSETATFTIENHLASVTVSPVEIIKAFSARIGVTIETELGVLEKGVVYSSTVKTPVIGDPACIKAVSESEDLFFGLDINYLQPETKYTVCGYVILDNSPDEGIVVYSAPVSFVTKPDDTPQFPDWDDMDWSVD